MLQLSMLRCLLAASVAGLAIVVVVPAFAADYSQGYGNLRPAYAEDWENEDPLDFEVGLRYWYSMGEQNFSASGAEYSANDKSQILEGHFRIDDRSTGSFLKGAVGYSVDIDGEYDSVFGSGGISDGRVGYGGADFGYTVLGNSKGGVGVSALAGYQYWNDSPNAGSRGFTTAESASDVAYSPVTGSWTVPRDSTTNNIDIHALRLGLSARAEINEYFDIDAEIAAVPYARVDGTLGSAGFSDFRIGSTTLTQSSPTTLSGSAYGAMGQLMVGISPTENFTIRLGGRAWYLEGKADTSFSRAAIGDATDQDPANPPNFDAPPTLSNQGFVSRSNPFSLFRYGLLAEVTYKF